MQTYISIDDYIAKQPKHAQEILQKIRQLIRTLAPEASEIISYGMPAFKLAGKNLVYFAAFKDHIGFFPTSSGVSHFQDQLSDFKTSKGTIQLPFDQPIPYELIAKITKFRIREVVTVKKLSAKEIDFYMSIKNDPNFQFVLQPETITGNIGHFPFCPDGNLLGKDKSFYIKSMQAIAAFHHHSKTLKLSVNSHVNYADSLKKVIAHALAQDIVLPGKQIAQLKASLPYIETHMILIHEDFLPQNVLIDKYEIKICDWENMSYGFAEHDVGRFLGDLENKNPKYNKKYYPYDWHDSLIDVYLHDRSKLDPTYDMKMGKELVNLGEMWNCLGPLEMCLDAKDTNSVWFNQNLKTLANL